MIRWLFILILSSLCWEKALAQTEANEPVSAQQQNLLILVDLQGALFYPRATGTKTASIQNPQVIEEIKSHKKLGAKILYLAEHSSEAMFWKNSITANHLPFEESFNLSNEIFHGFEEKMPTCRSGIVLCQDQPLGEILGLVINQLWVWTQFAPQKIIFYTSSKERGDIVSAIGLRIGALVEINLVQGIIGQPQIHNLKEAVTSKSILPSEIKKIKAPIKKESRSLKDILQKASGSPDESAISKKAFTPITIDESKLEHV